MRQETAALREFGLAYVGWGSNRVLTRRRKKAPLFDHFVGVPAGDARALRGVSALWASNGDGTPRRTQAVTILSRSARRWRDPSRTALTISGGEVKGVPPGNGGAGSYSIASWILRAVSSPATSA